MTVKAEPVRTASSGLCSLGQLILNQFELICLNSALWNNQGWTSSSRFVRALLSGTVKAEPVRTVSSALCSLGQLILKQFELFCLNSALWDSQCWTSSNRFVRVLLSGTVNSEAVRINLSKFRSLGQSMLNQFEPFRKGSAPWDSQGWTSSNRFVRVLLYLSTTILPCALITHSPRDRIKGSAEHKQIPAVGVQKLHLCRFNVMKQSQLHGSKLHFH